MKIDWHSDTGSDDARRVRMRRTMKPPCLQASLNACAAGGGGGGCGGRGFSVIFGYGAVRRYVYVSVIVCVTMGIILPPVRGEAIHLRRDFSDVRPKLKIDKIVTDEDAIVSVIALSFRSSFIFITISSHNSKILFSLPQ